MDKNKKAKIRYNYSLTFICMWWVRSPVNPASRIDPENIIWKEKK